MNKSDPKVYPITAGFEEQLKLIGIDIEIDEAVGPGATHEKIALITAASVMHETLGEYEHGTAEPEELISDEIRSLWNDQKKLASDEDELFNIESAQRRQAAMTIRNVYIDLLLTMGAK